MSGQSNKPMKLTPFAAALAGALGGCFSTAVVYPLDVAKTRIQAQPAVLGTTPSMTSVLLKVLEKEGLLGWYRGFGATMINTFSQQYAYFFFYSFARSWYTKRRKGPLSTAAELLLGAFAGALAQIFTIPVAVIATRQQVGPPSRPNSGVGTPLSPYNGNGTDDDIDDSFLGVAREIIEEEGVTGLWLGLKPGLVLTVNPAITYGVYERVKSLLVLAKTAAQSAKSSSEPLKLALSPWQSFLLGALSKTLATVVTYPYIMAKVRIQARSADSHVEIPHPHTYHHTHSRHVGALDILLRVWRRQGVLGWYQGMEAQIAKAVLASALLFTSREVFEQWAVAIILMLGRLRRGRPATA
ncbi:mitochondrial carrier [Fistulina hepatica ATCC 64428]|uniref:Mitochondrial carrier n=1 Tax=Fistulina hepatica ATCC 64428 TaxID=1128425 RepID=A0A0D7AKG9_9AGAR|nr:mitochondrial carrier [Fistulina hepatica ATCC 64428]